jgi:hypothetical protein
VAKILVGGKDGFQPQNLVDPSKVSNHIAILILSDDAPPGVRPPRLSSSNASPPAGPLDVLGFGMPDPGNPTSSKFRSTGSSTRNA